MHTPFLIFVVEDNDWYGERLVHQLSQNPDHSVRRFATAQACLEHLDQKPDFVTLDYHSADSLDRGVVRHIREQLPLTTVVVVADQKDVDAALTMLHHGAHAYLVKDQGTLDNLWELASEAARQVRQRHAAERLHQPTGHRRGVEQSPILGNHPTMRQLHSLIAKAAATNITVSISGETGTGKELVAKAIHCQSVRAAQPFVALNMSAIPRELLESELFGHEKGAFTGAIARRIGRLEEANGGTLFLDEIADLDINLQVKRLRVLQEREVTRVGGTKAVPFDVRLVVATHRHLPAEVCEGHFREDLYYRLLGLPIALPPLRERGNDVLLLAEAFNQAFCQQQKLPFRRLAESARRLLLAHPFPGNVRELRAVVELAAVLADGETLEAKDFSLPDAHLPTEARHANALRAQMKAIAQHCLDELGGDVEAAAQRLNISRSTIYRMVQNKEIRLG